VPTDPGFVLHDLPLLRIHALLAHAYGDEAAYRTSLEATALEPRRAASKDTGRC
jgi:hypothetical protein